MCRMCLCLRCVKSDGFVSEMWLCGDKMSLYLRSDVFVSEMFQMFLYLR